MLINQILSKLKSTLGYEPTNSQENLFKNLASFTLERKDNTILIVSGYAGTGKTTALSVYVQVLKSIDFKVVLLAPTGRAAKVFSAYSKAPAFTIHKKIYRQKASNDAFGKFNLDINLHTNTVFIIDEASMISNHANENSTFGSGYLLQDLIKYVNNGQNCKLIFVGDVAQLPPVGLDISPALNPDEIRFLADEVIQSELIHVVRQAEGSGILYNATELRSRIAENNLSLPLLYPEDFPDIVALHGSELIESISDSYAKHGNENTLVICRSNKRSNQYNQGIRNQVLWREDELSAGDLLMVVKNNYFWVNDFKEIDFIANGDIVEIIKVQGYRELYDFRFALCTIRLVDYDIEMDARLLVDTLHSETASLSTEDNRKLYANILEDYSEIKSKKKQYENIKGNEFFNALQVKYAYAVTCHKAQGGQWKEVYIDAGYLTKEMVTKEYLRWLYTAITRGTEKVYLVNFPDEFISLK